MSDASRKQPAHAATHSPGETSEERERFASTNSSPSGAVLNDAPTIVDVIQHLWKGRLWALIPALAGLVIAAFTIIGGNIVRPPETIHRAAISLAAIISREGTYPSGMPFSATDIRSPLVLKRAFESSGLKQYGLQLEEFITAVSAVPYTPGGDLVMERYEKLLAEGALDPARRILVQNDFRAILSEMKSDGALVSLTLSSKLGVPPAAAEAALDAILAAWSEIYVNELGAATPINSRYGNALIQSDQLEALDYASAYWRLLKAAEDAGLRLKGITEQPGAFNISIDASGWTLGDIGREIDDVRISLIEGTLAPIVAAGLSRNPKLTLLGLNSQIQDLTRKIEALGERAKATDDVIAFLDGRALARPSNAGPGVVAQFDNELIDRIVDLSLKGTDLELRRRYIERKLDFVSQGAELESRRGLLTSQRDAISQSGSVPDEDATLFDKSFRASAGEAARRLNEAWQNLNDATQLFAGQSLSADGKLYTRIPAPEVSLATRLASGTYLMYLTLGLLLFPALAGMLVYLLRSAAVHRRAA